MHVVAHVLLHHRAPSLNSGSMQNLCQYPWLSMASDLAVWSARLSRLPAAPSTTPRDCLACGPLTSVVASCYRERHFNVADATLELCVVGSWSAAASDDSQIGLHRVCDMSIAFPRLQSTLAIFQKSGELANVRGLSLRRQSAARLSPAFATKIASGRTTAAT